MNLEEIVNNISRIQRIEIPESVLNRQFQDNTIACEMAVFDGFLVLTTSNGLEAHLRYHSHNFDHTKDELYITLNVLKVRPLYYAMALPLISTRFPFLHYHKGSDGEKFITCDLARIPGLNRTLMTYKHSLKHITVENIECRPGMLIIGLGRQPTT